MKNPLLQFTRERCVTTGADFLLFELRAEAGLENGLILIYSVICLANPIHSPSISR